MERNDSETRRLAAQQQKDEQDVVNGRAGPHRDDQRLQEGIGRIDPGRRPETDERVEHEDFTDELLARLT